MDAGSMYSGGRLAGPLFQEDIDLLQNNVNVPPLLGGLPPSHAGVHSPAESQIWGLVKNDLKRIMLLVQQQSEATAGLKQDVAFLRLEIAVLKGDLSR